MKWLAQPAALALLIAVSVPWPADAQTAQSLEQQKRVAAEQRDLLRQRIDALEAELQKKDVQRRRASDALKKSELAISDATRQIASLGSAIESAQKALTALEHQIRDREGALAQDQAMLAAQLRAQYSSGLSPWSALLSGEDPQSLGRELGYLSFVSGARVEVIDRLQRALTELSALQADLTSKQAALTAQKERLEAQKQTLAKQREARAKLLTELEGSIAAERAEHDRLAQDEQRLGELIQGLGQQLADLRSDARHAEAIRADMLAALPQGETMKRGIPMPVQGPVLARFGSDRPDGGDWRGVLIGTNPGAPVKAVAAGTVVYATWLRGFGNLIVLDHGDEFLTIYAHNEGLLKEVGQTVRAGDVIASAGNTGGQLDSALYFEIRHRGAPLDPMLYFKR